MSLTLSKFHVFLDYYTGKTCMFQERQPPSDRYAHITRYENRMGMKVRYSTTDLATGEKDVPIYKISIFKSGRHVQGYNLIIPDNVVKQMVINKLKDGNK